MIKETLVLAANPGNNSSNYAIYRADKHLATMRFEHEEGRIVCNLVTGSKTEKYYPEINNLHSCAPHIVPILKQSKIIDKPLFRCLGLRVAAPTSYFLHDHILNDEVLAKLSTLESRAPLHISLVKNEVNSLKQAFGVIPIVLISDSAFHAAKPDFAWNYAIPLDDADTFEIKRYGYHGITLASVVRELKLAKALPDKLIVCHLCNGASVTAIVNGTSYDTTMGYTPLDGLIMGTRSGSIDAMATQALMDELNLDSAGLEYYLNYQSGLKGISGFTSDIRELLVTEETGDYRAGLALRMYVNRIQQGIGQMVASMNGFDVLVFTGTVGDKSPIIRQRVIEGLSHLGLFLEYPINNRIIEPKRLERISPRKRLKRIYVLTTDEAQEIANRANKFIET